MLELIIVTLALYLLALSAAMLLSEAGEANKRAEEEAVAEIDALLPQTQCGDCGYPGCLPYARAIVEQDAPLNLCPPGGAVTVTKLEKLLGRTSYRHSAPVTPENTIALIDEDTCIGCVKCIHRLPGRCHRRQRQTTARSHPGILYRLRTVPSPLSGRLHHHDPPAPGTTSTDRIN